MLNIFMPFFLSQVFYDICVIPALQRLASSNNDVAAKQAILALRTIGEEIPAKLSFNISCWTIKEVQMWVGNIKRTSGGFTCDTL